jgi:hypothetical protein
LPQALEAAHIRSVSDGGNDNPQNSFLLRADIHRLFDLGLITISEKPPHRIWIHNKREGTRYARFGRVAGSLGLGQVKALAERNKSWTAEHGVAPIAEA